MVVNVIFLAIHGVADVENVDILTKVNVVMKTMDGHAIAALNRIQKEVVQSIRRKSRTYGNK